MNIGEYMENEEKLEEIKEESVDSSSDTLSLEDGIEEVLVGEPEESKSTKKSSGVNLLAIFGIIIAVLLLFLAVFMNIPAKKYLRTLTKADALFAEQDYDKAMLKYEKAAGIYEGSPRAAYGYVLCLQAKERDSKEIEEVYITKTDSFINHPEDAKGEEDVRIDYYLLAPSVIEGCDKRLEVVLTGYELMDKPVELDSLLADTYYLVGTGLYEEGKYTDALADFDLCLSLSNDATEYVQSVKACTEDYISALLNQDNYDEAFSIADKYAAVLGDDFETVSERISTAESLYNVKNELLSSVYSVMKAYYDEGHVDFSEDTVASCEGPVFRVMNFDWNELLLLDDSAYANMLAYSFTKDCYLYAEGGFTSDYTGIGCGLYTYGGIYTDENGNSSTGYYFYFGDYKNGKRDGYGVSFVRVDSTSYYAFEGEWKDDAPNGFGALYESNMYAYTSLKEYGIVTFGNWTNGLEDGEMECRATLNEHPDTYFSGSHTATNGVVPPLEGEPIYYGILSDTPEGWDLVIVLPSVDNGYDYNMPIYLKQGKVFGVFGF